MNSLRVLMVGDTEHSERAATCLEQEGYNVVPVSDCSEAAEALEIQKFDAVVLGSDLLPGELSRFAATVVELNGRSQTRTALLRMSAAATSTAVEPPGIDGSVSETADPGTLTATIARLATAVGSSPEVNASSGSTETVVLDVEQLRDQVADDDELLVELIDLYFSERARQSEEMEEALQSKDSDLLSRLAHTIKGSLGSLHAPIARSIAQSLEGAAKDGDMETCRSLLPLFESALNTLQAELTALKSSLSPSG